MKLLIVLLPLISSLRFPTEEDATSDIRDVRSDLKVDSEYSASWCQQFPYCPTGCSLFCTEGVPIIPAVAVPTVLSRGGIHRRSHHKKSRRRRRKTAAQLVTVVAAALKLKLDGVLLDKLTQADMTKLETDAAFRSAVRKMICENLGTSVCKEPSEAEKVILDLEIQFEKDGGLLALVEIEGLQSKGKVDEAHSLKTTFNIVAKDTAAITTVKAVLAKKPVKPVVKTTAAASKTFLQSTLEELVKQVGKALAKPLTDAQLNQIVDDVCKTIAKAITDGTLESMNAIPEVKKDIVRKPQPAPSPSPEGDDSSDDSSDGSR